MARQSAFRFIFTFRYHVFFKDFRLEPVSSFLKKSFGQLDKIKFFFFHQTVSTYIWAPFLCNQISIIISWSIFCSTRRNNCNVRKSIVPGTHKCQRHVEIIVIFVWWGQIKFTTNLRNVVMVMEFKAWNIPVKKLI